MTKDNMDMQIKQLELEHERRVNSIYKEYAFSNNLVRIGQIIEDHMNIIKVDEIKWYKSFGYPMCVYFGIPLKKDLTAKKTDKKETIYQQNIKKIYD